MATRDGATVEHVDDADGSTTTPAGRRSHRRSRGLPGWLRSVASIAVIAAILWAGRSLVDWSQVWAAILDMSWLELLTLALAAGWNIATYLFVMMAAMPGLTYRDAFIVGQSSTAVAATLPAGSALGVGMTYSMYSSLGHSGAEIGLATVLTGIWNNFVKLGLPVVALAILAVMGDSTTAELVAAGTGVAALLVAVAVFALVLRSDDLAARMGQWAQRLARPLLRVVRRDERGPWADTFVQFRHQTIDLLRDRWLVLTVATVVSHLSLYVVLLLALRHMDVSDAMVGWAQVLSIFALTRLVTALPVTPGGLGVVELALTAGLVVAGGPRAPVVAAVLVFRVLTLFVQVPIGAGCYVWWRATDGRRSAGTAEVEPSSGPS
ncbi:MAG TPA: YbhN family protein [Euzebyales bacterium]